MNTRRIAAAVMLTATGITAGAIALHSDGGDSPERACGRRLVADLHLPKSAAVHASTRQVGEAFTVAGTAGPTRFACTVRHVGGRWELVGLSAAS